jgi:hypothetical protein
MFTVDQRAVSSGIAWGQQLRHRDIAEVRVGEIGSADYVTKRRSLEIVCLNSTLQDVTLVTTKRKPFDFLVERLKNDFSRGDRTAIELFLREIQGWEAGFHHFFDGLAEGKRSQPKNSLAGGQIG